MPCVYILYSKNAARFYTGSSRENDPAKRLIAHNLGRTKSTKSHRPWTLVKYEKYDNFTDARKREIFLKTGHGRKWVYENFRSR